MTHTSATPSWIPAAPALAARLRRGLRVLVAIAVVSWALSGAAAAAPEARQHAGGEAVATSAPAAQHAVEAQREHGEAEGEGGHAESPWAAVARVFNFALLAGALVYLLRSPLAGYLEQRGVQVRSDLTKAAALREEAAVQIATIEARLRALPGEIDALKLRGAEEIAAEERRIRELAESERQRLREHAKREIDTQLRVAERELKKRAGELAVEVATERVKRTITDRDHARLVERYVAQVRQ